MTNDSADGEILFERRGKAGIITLNRPASLNAINHDMIVAISETLTRWEADDAVKLVAIKGNGRAFSAGGDILDVYKAGRAGGKPIGFFADEYRLNAAIARFPKPYVALIDGIVMGGGVGVSFHGSHRVVTDKTMFAMPEVGIGFFPDIGGSYLLSRVPDQYGMSLALTGNRIKRDEIIAAGLATHVADSQDLPAILDRLSETGDVDSSLSSFTPERREEIPAHTKQHFSHETLEECLESLERASQGGESIAQETLETLSKRSPTSLHLTFRQIRRGGVLSMDDCMRMEFRITNRMLERHDFYEGVRAALIDKTHAPVWKPASLGSIDPAEIEAYFAPLENGELEL